MLHCVSWITAVPDKIGGTSWAMTAELWLRRNQRLDYHTEGSFLNALNEIEIMT